MKDETQKETEGLDSTVYVSGQLARVESGIEGLQIILERVDKTMASSREDLDKISKRVEEAATEFTETLDAVRAPLAKWWGYIVFCLIVGACCMFAATAAIVTMAIEFVS